MALTFRNDGCTSADLVKRPPDVFAFRAKCICCFSVFFFFQFKASIRNKLIYFFYTNSFLAFLSIFDFSEAKNSPFFFFFNFPAPHVEHLPDMAAHVIYRKILF